MSGGNKKVTHLVWTQFLKFCFKKKLNWTMRPNHTELKVIITHSQKVKLRQCRRRWRINFSSGNSHSSSMSWLTCTDPQGNYFILTLHKKWGFPLRIFLVYANKSENCEFANIYYKKSLTETLFFVKCRNLLLNMLMKYKCNIFLLDFEVEVPYPLFLVLLNIYD